MSIIPEICGTGHRQAPFLMKAIGLSGNDLTLVSGEANDEQFHP